MFIITQYEATKLREKFKEDTCIKICSAQKRHGGKTYWCAENKKFKNYVEQLRSSNTEK